MAGDEILGKNVEGPDQHPDPTGKPNLSNNPQLSPIAIDAHLSVSEEDKRENRAYQRRNLGIQIVLTLGTWAAFGAAAYYAHTAKQQWRTMNQTYEKIQRQTDLMQTEVEGSMAAVITKDFRATWGDRTYLSVIMANRGRLDASSIHGDIQVDKISLPNEKPTGAVLPKWAFDITELDGSPDAQAVRGIYLDVSPNDLEASSDMREAIKVTGTITYFNGFRNKSDSVCYYILSTLEFRNKSGAVQQTFGSSRAACDDFPRLMADDLKIKKDISSK